MFAAELTISCLIALALLLVIGTAHVNGLNPLQNWTSKLYFVTACILVSATNVVNFVVGSEKSNYSWVPFVIGVGAALQFCYQTCCKIEKKT